MRKKRRRGRGMRSVLLVVQDAHRSALVTHRVTRCAAKSIARSRGRSVVLSETVGNSMPVMAARRPTNGQPAPQKGSAMWEQYLAVVNRRESIPYAYTGTRENLLRVGYHTQHKIASVFYHPRQLLMQCMTIRFVFSSRSTKGKSQLRMWSLFGVF